MLGYCQKLGVPLEVEVNMTRSAFLQNDNANDGKPMVLRQVENDTRGHVSELLAKTINQGALDQDLSQEDRDRMLSFLRSTAHWTTRASTSEAIVLDTPRWQAQATRRAR